MDIPVGIYAHLLLICSSRFAQPRDWIHSQVLACLIVGDKIWRPSIKRGVPTRFMGPGSSYLNWSYPLANKHSNGKPPFPIGNIASKGHFPLLCSFTGFFSLSLRDSRGGLPRAPHGSGSPNQDGIELASAHLAVLLLNPGKRPQHQPTLWLLGLAAGICGCSFGLSRIFWRRNLGGHCHQRGNAVLVGWWTGKSITHWKDQCLPNRVPWKAYCIRLPPIPVPDAALPGGPYALVLHGETHPAWLVWREDSPYSFYIHPYQQD